VRRRELFPLIAGLALGSPSSATPSDAVTDMAFDTSTVRNLARALARKPYQPPDSVLPAALNDLDYSTYQTLRFNKDKALWRGSGGKFTVEFFHRGYLFRDRVDISEVAEGRATPIQYAPEMFDLHKLAAAPDANLGFAGFRIHYPLNRPDYFDEVCTFVGASYFRAVARGQGYGLSARGLAIKTADPGGEEFPLFKRFWLERPANGGEVLVIHALLDSPSAAAAFRFTVRPGAETIMDTEMALYPRTDLPQAGLAPMTSMFFFDSNDRAGFDDYRNAVHDSNGLALLTGKGERIWRTLNNPRTLQISAFQDSSVRGFGLGQRKRGFADYQDLEAAYEKRPTLWVEPIGDWGQGATTLVEIPSDREVNDNIVAFWKPKDTLLANGEYILSYRLHWCWDPPEDPALAKVKQVRCGLSFDHKSRQFVIDFTGAPSPGHAGAPPQLDLSADNGRLHDATVQPAEGESGWRLAFQLDPGDAKSIELRARLHQGGTPVSETWLYRWTV